MEKVNVIGWRKVEFDSATGQHISGYSGYYLRDLSSSEGVGQTVEKIFVNSRSFDMEKIGISPGVYEFEFGFRGRIIDIRKGK